MARVVYSRRGVIDGADERVFVRMLGHARKDFANLDAVHVGRDGLVGAADFGGRVRLHVPGVNLARPTNEHQEDAVGVFLRIHRAERFQREEIRQGEAEEGERAGVQEIAPRQAVAKMARLVSVESVHGIPLTLRIMKRLVVGTPQIGSAAPLTTLAISGRRMG